jgi:pimeloyl-ACP methyl ester carboxylesterase
MEKARGRGVALQLAVWNGAPPPVLCVHGLSANCRSFDTIAASLAPRYKVIALDLRGRGLSDKPKRGYSIRHHVLDVKALMDDLGLDRAILVGHSLGASIVASFAAGHPKRVDRVVLIDGAGRLNRGQAALVWRGIRPSLERLGRTFPSFEAYAEQMKKAPFFRPWTDAIETYFRYEVEDVVGGVRSRVSPACVVEEMKNLARGDIAAAYGRIRCPTLILRAPAGMQGRGDILLPKSALRRMVGDIRDVWAVDLPGTNHYSIVFGRNEVRDGVIRAFFESR